VKNYQHQTKDALLREKSQLLHDIAGWKNTLESVKSYLIVLYLKHAIGKAEEKIHAIEAELLYREHN
jgi:hypothetical protein